MFSLVLLIGSAFFLTLVLTPLCRAICTRWGWVDLPDARKVHRTPVPRTGGIAILLGYAAAFLILVGSPLSAAHYVSVALPGFVALLPAVMVAFLTGLLLPAASPLMVDIGRWHINDKILHFSACLALSMLPVIGFRERRRGVMAGLGMFLLGVLMEGGQHFSPGRAVEAGDVLADGLGVACGILLASPLRTLLAIQ